MLKEGHFYIDPTTNFFYFCEKIENGIVSWVLVESWQYGDLIQTRFSQSIEAGQNFVEVKDTEDLKRLERMLEELNNIDKEAEFLKFIEEIDDLLKKKNVPIFRRPLDAIGEICVRRKIALPGIPEGPAVPGLFSGDSLVAHVYDWYKKRYGDRLKADFSPGSAVAIIKGDLWKIRFPVLLGEAKFVFDPDLEKYEKGSIAKFNEPLIVNPLNSIEGFTSEMANSLSEAEMSQVAQFYMSTFKTLRRLFEIKNKPFIPEARCDLDSAVNNILISPPNYGQSKWASLQFTEKLFKCFLKLKDVGFPKNHDLNLLSSLAFQNGLPTISNLILQAIQCSAGVRYGEKGTTLQEAILAHHSSLKACSLLAPTIKTIK